MRGDAPLSAFLLNCRGERHIIAQTRPRRQHVDFDRLETGTNASSQALRVRHRQVVHVTGPSAPEASRSRPSARRVLD